MAAVAATRAAPCAAPLRRCLFGHSRAEVVYDCC